MKVNELDGQSHSVVGFHNRLRGHTDLDLILASI